MASVVVCWIQTVLLYAGLPEHSEDIWQKEEVRTIEVVTVSQTATPEGHPYPFSMGVYILRIRPCSFSDSMGVFSG